MRERDGSAGGGAAAGGARGRAGDARVKAACRCAAGQRPLPHERGRSAAAAHAVRASLHVFAMQSVGNTKALLAAQRSARQLRAADSSCCWSRGRPCCQAMLNACGDTPWLLVARSGLVSEVRSGLVSAVRRHRVGRLSFPAGSSMLSWGPPAPSQRAGAGGRGRATRVWPTPTLASAQAPGRRGGPAGPARGAHRPGQPADL